MAPVICDRCGQNPATLTVRRSGTAGESTQRLCGSCASELGIGGSMGRGSIGGLGMFDDLMSRFFDQGGSGAVPGAARRATQQVERVDITKLFSDATRTVLQKAAETAHDWGSLELESEHLLAGVLADAGARTALEHVGASPDDLAAQLEQEADRQEPTDVAPSLSPEVKRALLAAHEEARALGDDFIGPVHVLLALVRDEEAAAGDLLQRFGITHVALRGAAARGAGSPEGVPTKSETEALDEFSRDLTELAKQGKIDPVIGRAEEIEETVEILSRRTKNNPVLIGEPGVGKTAIAEGIAQRIVNDEVPETLAGKRLLALDLSGMVAGTKYRGEFEERLKNVIDEITEHADDVIVFIDELHTVVGAGASEGSMDAANMLKPALARGELHVIGATTLDEYRKHIEKDPALERRFQPVLVKEPTVEAAIEILYGLRDRYEAFHRVRIADEAVVAAVELSDRYVSDRFLPDKAIDLMDQAAARVRLRSKTKAPDIKGLEEERDRLSREKDQAVRSEQFERAAELKGDLADLDERIDDAKAGRGEKPEVRLDDIAEVLSRATGIPVAQLTQEERERLLQLEQILHQRVVGQGDAVVAVSEAVRRARAGLGDPNRPVGSFLFLGPTGVGKTELARALAEAMFGDEDLMVRFDMSEFQERHAVSRLVGAPPGYVGYDDAGQLTEQVRRQPYSVLLFDEIEKAHPDVFNILLQLLDDGRITDGQGRTVDCKNVVVIMTSNIGADRIQEHADRDEPFDEMRDEVLALLSQRFRPEFINRIDEIIVFRALDREQVSQIAGMLLERTRRRLGAQDIGVTFTPAAVEVVADEGFDPKFGARPLKRAVQRLVENELSRLVLEGGLNPGDHVTVDADNGALVFEVGAATQDQPDASSSDEGPEDPDTASDGDGVREEASGDAE